MTFLVKDFAPTLQRWVSWACQSVSTAYDDYPYSNSTYPSIAQLSKKLIVLKDLSAQGSESVIPTASMWNIVNSDLVPSMIVDGHTGSWSVEIRRQEIYNAIGVSTDGVNTQIAYDSYLSYKLDEAGAITSEVTFDGEVQGFINDLGQVVFKTPAEYSIDDVPISLPSTAILPNAFVDIVPSATGMPDIYWKYQNNDVILK